jgi:hypothetical protein
MPTGLQLQVYKTESLRYLTQELGNEKWRLAFGVGTRRRQVRRPHAENTKAPLTSVRSTAQEKSLGCNRTKNTASAAIAS